MKRSCLLALAALTACTGQTAPATAALREPTASAAFLGWTPDRPRQAYPLPQPYLAVANGRSDELRLFDLATQKPLMSPGFAFPLSVPTLPRPSFLAASSLRDAGSDLLAVAGVGAVVDILSTWDDGSGPGGGGSRVVVQYDLSGLAGPGAEILSMVATPVPGAPAGSPPVAPAQPGRAWLILGFSGASDGLGGKLLVLEFARMADGSVALAAPPQVKPLSFDPVSLAVSPDLFHLYCATPDLVTDFTAFPPAPGARQVQGVGEVDMSGGATAPWAVRGLDARAPTSLVAAAILGERVPTSPDVFGAPALRVYAALDPSGCGPDKAIACGIAVIDPALGGLAPDLAPAGGGVPAQGYRTPMLVPAAPLALGVALPAASGPLQCLEGDPCPPQTIEQPLAMLIANGQRWTTALGAVGGSDGSTYLLDLGRSGPASDISLLNSDDTRTGVASASSLTPFRPDGTTATAGLALYRQYPDPNTAPDFTSDSVKMAKAVIVTPGFTRGESWSLTWQGFLPGLAARSFVLRLEAGGSLSLAFQAAMGGQWDVTARVTDPSLGIHAADAWPEGDLAQFTLPVEQFGTAGNPCALADDTRYETVIASILAASPDHPGGALRLAVPASGESDPFSIRCLRDFLAAPGAPALLSGTVGSVRASGLVLVGSSSGYAGRPGLLTKAELDGGQAAAKRFNLAWQDEGALSGEALVLARKARRFFYANDVLKVAANYPEMNGDPLAPGPVIGLIAGPLCADEPPGSRTPGICPPARLNELLRDSAIVFSTRSGVLPSSRLPTTLSLPSSVIAFDRSQFPDAVPLGSVFYVTYRQNAVLVAVPGQTPNISGTIR